MPFVRRHPVVSFFVLAYGLSWAYWIPLALSGVRTAPGSSTTHEPGLLGPALAAFIITGLNEGRSGVTAFARRLVLVSRPTSRFLIYSLSPLIFLALAIVVGLVARAPLPPLSEFAIYQACRRSAYPRSGCWCCCSTGSAKKPVGVASPSSRSNDGTARSLER